ncbi:phosphoribosyl-dephospho-CoA transferase, partial [Stenotrophomonas maltophilia]
MPLPPREGKQPLALRLALQDIHHLQPPPAQDEILPRGGPADRPAALQANLRRAPARGLGAIAGQHHSGRPD